MNNISRFFRKVYNKIKLELHIKNNEIHFKHFYLSSPMLLDGEKLRIVKNCRFIAKKDFKGGSMLILKNGVYLEHCLIDNLNAKNVVCVK